MSQEDVLKAVEKNILANSKELEKITKLSKRAIQRALVSLIKQGEILVFQIKNRRFYATKRIYLNPHEVQSKNRK